MSYIFVLNFFKKNEENLSMLLFEKSKGILQVGLPVGNASIFNFLMFYLSIYFLQAGDLVLYEEAAVLGPLLGPMVMQEFVINFINILYNILN